MPNYFYCYVDEDTHPHILITEHSEKGLRDFIKRQGRFKGNFFLTPTGEIKSLTANSGPLLVVPPKQMKKIMADCLQKLKSRIKSIELNMPE